MIGGDTARDDQVVLAVTGLGDLAGRAPVLRSGAGPGNLVAVAGPLGHTTAGLALLETGLSGDRLVARIWWQRTCGPRRPTTPAPRRPGWAPPR